MCKLYDFHILKLSHSHGMSPPSLYLSQNLVLWVMMYWIVPAIFWRRNTTSHRPPCKWRAIMNSWMTALTARSQSAQVSCRGCCHDFWGRNHNQAHERSYLFSVTPNTFLCVCVILYPLQCHMSTNLISCAAARALKNCNHMLQITYWVSSQASLLAPCTCTFKLKLW